MIPLGNGFEGATRAADFSKISLAVWWLQKRRERQFSWELAPLPPRRFPPSASAGRPVPPNRAPLSSANYCTTSVHERLFPSFRLGAQYGGANRCFLIPCIPCMRPFESSCICPSLSRRFSLTAGSLPPTRDHRRAPEGSAARPAAESYVKPRPSFLRRPRPQPSEEH